jgi:hypothetical protein
MKKVLIIAATIFALFGVSGAQAATKKPVVKKYHPHYVHKKAAKKPLTKVRKAS